MHGLWHDYIDRASERLPSLKRGRQIDSFDAWRSLDSLDSPSCDLILSPAAGTTPPRRRTDSEIRESLLREISKGRSPSRAHRDLLVVRSHITRSIVWALPQLVIALVGGLLFMGLAGLYRAIRRRGPVHAREA